MFSCTKSEAQITMAIDRQKHCVLCAASNPYPLPTPVFGSPGHASKQENEISEFQTQAWFADAETVANEFAHCSVSLSVILPKQLLKLLSVYSAGNPNSSAADAAREHIKSPQPLIIISEKLMYACSSGTQSNEKLNANPIVIKESEAMNSVSPPSQELKPVRPSSSQTAVTSVSLQAATDSVIPSSGQAGFCAQTCNSAETLNANSNVIKDSAAISLISSQPQLVSGRPPPGQEGKRKMTEQPQTSQRRMRRKTVPSNTPDTQSSGSPRMTSGQFPHGNTSSSGLPRIGSGSSLSSASQVGSCQHPSLATRKTKRKSAITNVQNFQSLVGNPPQQHRCNITASVTNVSLVNDLSHTLLGSTALPGASTQALGEASSTRSRMHRTHLLGNEMSSESISTNKDALMTGNSSSISARSSAGLTGIGQSTSTVSQDSINYEVNIFGMSNLADGQSGSSVHSGISHTQEVGGQGQSIGRIGRGGMGMESQTGQHGVEMNQNVQDRKVLVGASSVIRTTIPQHGINQLVQPGNVQELGECNNSANNLQFVSKAPSAQYRTEAKPNLTKVWEGLLTVVKHGQPVPLSKVEAYRAITSPERIAADWPESIVITKVYQRNHIFKSECHRKAENVIFRILKMHSFFMHLTSKNLVALIQLPNQMLLLRTTDTLGQLVGMLFRKDFVLFKPSISNQPDIQKEQQPQQQRQKLPQEIPSETGNIFYQSQLPNQTRLQPPQQHLQQKQQQQLQQPHGIAIGQAFSQSQLPNQTRPQLISQSHVEGQGPATMGT